jgi:hypothetical protein
MQKTIRESDSMRTQSFFSVFFFFGVVGNGKQIDFFVQRERNTTDMYITQATHSKQSKANKQQRKSSNIKRG